MEGEKLKAENSFKECTETMRKAATDIGQKVKENPWPVLAGTVVVCFFLGFFMGSSRKS